MLERNGEIRSEIEQLVLDAYEHRANLRRALTGDDDAENGVELVHGPVGGDALIELRDARAVPERRLSCVAAARVDLGQPDRLVAFAWHARRVGR